jgi:hypothetical protein
MDIQIGDKMPREDIHDQQETAIKAGDYSRFI